MIVDRLIALCYFLLFSVTPLLMYSKTSELFEFNKMLFIYFIAITVICLWITKMIFLKKIIFKHTFLDFFILPFFLSQLVSTILSIDRHTSIFGYYGRFNGGLLSLIAYLILYYGLISNLFFIKEKLVNNDLLLKVSLVASSIVIFWGLPGHFGYDLSCFAFTGELSNLCWTSQFKPHERMFSTLGQPNWLGAYLVINFFLAFYLFLKNKNNKLHVVSYTIYLFLNFTAVLFTRSRSALAALVIGLVFCLLYLIKEKQLEKQIIVKLLIISVIPILLFKTGIPSVDKLISVPSFNRVEAPVVNQEKISVGSDGVTESFDIRKIVWQGAISLALQYPLFGTGVETFAYSYNFVRPRDHNLTSEWDFIYNKAHNEYLNYLATTGFVGLGTYLLFIAGVIIALMYKLKGLSSKVKANLKNVKLESLNDERRLFIFLLISWMTILITNFFGFSTTTINIYFYLIPALTIIYISDTSIDTRPHKNLNRVQQLLLIFPLTLFIFGSVYILNYFLADVSYAAGDNFFKIQQYKQAEDKLDQAILMRREPVYYDKLASTIANKALFDLASNQTSDKTALRSQINQNYTKATNASQYALINSPRNVYYYRTLSKVLYIFYQIGSDAKVFDQSISTINTAVSLAPTDAKLFYTKALFYTSREDTSPNQANNSENLKLALLNAEKAIELKDDYRDAYLVKGTILKKMNRKSEARQIFEFMLKKFNPEDQEVIAEIETL